MSEPEGNQRVGVTHFSPEEEKERQKRVVESVASRQSDDEQGSNVQTLPEDTQKNPNRS